MPSLGDTFRAINELKATGVVEDYAVAGAMALVFWTEPIATFDLDVLVAMPSDGSRLLSLDGLYEWAQARGYPIQAEHIVVEGMPTQFLPSPNLLAREALTAASEIDYQGVRVRVVRPEYSDSPSSNPAVGDAWPSEELLLRLRNGKAELHAFHAGLPLREKVRLVMELQRMVLPLIARQRPLRPWERPWEIEP